MHKPPAPRCRAATMPLLLAVALLCGLVPLARGKVFNVKDFGAKVGLRVPRAADYCRACLRLVRCPPAPWHGAKQRADGPSFPSLPRSASVLPPIPLLPLVSMLFVPLVPPRPLSSKIVIG